MARITDRNGLFHSLETGKAFVSCTCCGTPLNESAPDPLSDDLGITFMSSIPYLVAKTFHKGECVFEYALCNGCREEMAEKISEESKASLAKFFANKVGPEKHTQTLDGALDPVEWIAHCAACGSARAQSESYSIAALFHEHALVFDPYPACFCGQCEEEIQEGLSKETLGTWDDFVDTYFDSPPANVRNLPVGGRPLHI